MGVLAALILPMVGAVKKHQYHLSTPRRKWRKLETAIDRYKAAYGFYPPEISQFPRATSAGQPALL